MHINLTFEQQALQLTKIEQSREPAQEKLGLGCATRVNTVPGATTS